MFSIIIDVVESLIWVILQMKRMKSAICQQLSFYTEGRFVLHGDTTVVNILFLIPSPRLSRHLVLWYLWILNGKHGHVIDFFFVYLLKPISFRSLHFCLPEKKDRWLLLLCLIWLERESTEGIRWYTRSDVATSESDFDGRICFIIVLNFNS